MGCMKKRLPSPPSTWALAVLLLSLAAAAPAETFTLGAENAAGPWGQADGAGCGNDLVRAAFKAAGADLSLRILPYARAKAMALSGELDGCFGMSWEPELEGRIVLAASPLYRVSAVILEAKATPLRPASIEGFRGGMVLGTVIDYEYPAALLSLKARGVGLEETASEVQNLQKLALGRLDAAVVMADDLKSVDVVLRLAGVGEAVRESFVIGGQGTYVGFSLSSPRGKAAKAAFDRGMALIRQDGSYARIIAEWSDRLRNGQ